MTTDVMRANNSQKGGRKCLIVAARRRRKAVVIRKHKTTNTVLALKANGVYSFASLNILRELGRWEEDGPQRRRGDSGLGKGGSALSFCRFSF